MAYEDPSVRVWEMHLAPRELTGVHTHRNDFMFLVVDPSVIEIRNGWGMLLVHNEMTAGEVSSFGLDGDQLVDVTGDHQPISNTHEARIVEIRTYREALVEKKAWRASRAGCPAH